jgi:hypothetical protein
MTSILDVAYSPLVQPLLALSVIVPMQVAISFEPRFYAIAQNDL